MTADTQWPTTEQYALAHRCTTCGAEPGERCEAPRKAARKARLDRLAVQAGRSPSAEQAHRDLHVKRQDAGWRHWRRDVGAAPWPEEREPGKRYDTVSDEILKATVST